LTLNIENKKIYDILKSKVRKSQKDKEGQKIVCTMTMKGCEIVSSLAKQIEEYIKELMRQQESAVLEIQRSLLSEQFHCVPSQINYVLSTRFTPAQGYVVESRRGGGGFVRIASIGLESEDDLRQLIAKSVGEQITERQSEGVVDYLLKEKIITPREGAMLNLMLKDRTLSEVKENRDGLRAKLLQHALVIVYEKEKI